MSIKVRHALGMWTRSVSWKPDGGSPDTGARMASMHIMLNNLGNLGHHTATYENVHWLIMANAGNGQIRENSKV